MTPLLRSLATAHAPGVFLLPGIAAPTVETGVSCPCEDPMNHDALHLLCGSTSLATTRVPLVDITAQARSTLLAASPLELAALSGAVAQRRVVGPRPASGPRPPAPPGAPTEPRGAGAAGCGPPRTGMLLLHAPRGPGSDQGARIFQVPARVAFGWGRTASSARLPGLLQARLEREFGEDLGGVRVRLGPEPTTLGARALTMGDQLYFDPRAYQPDTAGGEALVRAQVAWALQARWLGFSMLGGFAGYHVLGGMLGGPLGVGVGALAGFALHRYTRTRPAIHFVWFGTGLPNDSNTRTPGLLARDLDADVTFWCLAPVRPRFATALGRSVRVRDLDEVLGQTARWAGHAFVGRVRTILEFYGDNRGYAPAKDLLTYLILASYGGYFFDANCVIVERERFARAIAAPRRFPAFIALRTPVNFDPNATALPLDDINADTTYMALVIGLGSDITYPETDMWAMYCPPGHTMFRTIAQEYVARAEMLGIGTPAQDRVGSQRIGWDTFVNGGSDGKRTVAGALGGQSIFAGMYRHRNDPGYDPRHANWVTNQVRNRQVESGREQGRQLAGDADYWVAELGLAKAHGGTW